MTKTASFNETLAVLYDLPQASLQQPSCHGCARGGTARDLLLHNIFHEKQHAGQVWSVRDQLQLLPGWGNQDLPGPRGRRARVLLGPQLHRHAPRRAS
jgi:hypothetical protein